MVGNDFKFLTHFYTILIGLVLSVREKEEKRKGEVSMKMREGERTKGSDQNKAEFLML